MSGQKGAPGGYEPSLDTVEMVLERLGEMGLAVGPDTARELVRAVLAAEAPRVDAHLREALDTALQTIRVASQAAAAVLAATTAAESRPAQPARPAAQPPAPAPAKAPPAPAARPHRPAEPADEDDRPPPPRRGDEFSDEHRPVFRRPRGR